MLDNLCLKVQIIPLIPSFAELGFLLLMSMYDMRYLLNDSSVSVSLGNWV